MADSQIATLLAARELIFVVSFSDLVHYSVVSVCIYKTRPKTLSRLNVALVPESRLERLQQIRVRWESEIEVDRLLDLIRLEPTATLTSHQPLIASSVRQIVRQIPGRLLMFLIMTADMIIFMTVGMITVKKHSRTPWRGRRLIIAE